MSDREWRQVFRWLFSKLLGIGFLLSFTPWLWAAGIALGLGFICIAMSGQFGWVFRDVCRVS